MRIVLSDKMTDEEKLNALHCINNEIVLRQSMHKRICHFEIIIPYEKRTEETYIIDPSLYALFSNPRGNKIIYPVDSIESNGKYRFEIRTDGDYLNIYGMNSSDIMVFKHRISSSLAKKICNVIIEESEKRWANKIFVRVDGLYGDINNSLICKYSDFGFKQLDTAKENKKLKAGEVPVRMKGLALKIVDELNYYQKNVKFISETYSESFKDGKDTYSDNVDLLGEFNVVIKRAPEEVKTNTLRDW